ncbi:MAG: AAA family ATPase [Acidobacteria bacterium]|nr:AAA family ATPase [Acidobacteriota bacterium]
MLAAITFGPNRQLVSYLQEACSGLGDLCIYKTVYAYPEPYQLVQLLDVFNPEVVFLEIGATETELRIAREIRSCHPKTAVLGFGQHCDPERLRTLTESGVDENLLQPFDSEKLQQVVTRVVAAKAAGVRDNVIAFLPAKAGNGATTTASRLAASLAQDWQQKLLLLEADLESGALAVLLGLEPEHSIIDALEQSQWLTDALWSTLPSKVHGFELLPMPGARSSAAISRWEYQRVLTFARARYDTVIVDLPELVDDATEAIVHQAKVVYIVCTPEKPSLFLARRRVDELTLRRAPESRLQIVLNRCRDQGAKREEIEKFLERKVSFILPDEDRYFRPEAEPPSVRADGLPQAGRQDSRLLPARREATPGAAPGIPAPARSELAEAYFSFARILAGVEPPPPPPPPPEPKTGLRFLFRHRAILHS